MEEFHVISKLDINNEKKLIPRKESKVIAIFKNENMAMIFCNFIKEEWYRQCDEEGRLTHEKEKYLPVIQIKVGSQFNSIP